MYELSGSVRDAYGELLRHQVLLVGLGARFGEGCGESSLGRFALLCMGTFFFNAYIIT